MKKFMIAGLVLVFGLSACQDKRLSDNEMPWHDGDFAQAQEVAESGQEIMLFFKTEW
ncbi:MAG: hypothetical protein MAGBODY4_00586 [Candidatus Marinimicrobia bacterium]|nr:hypothetical protein [Candidatus Neomarinimicrobiota bacterium]